MQPLYALIVLSKRCGCEIARRSGRLTDADRTEFVRGRVGPAGAVLTTYPLGADLPTDPPKRCGTAACCR